MARAKVKTAKPSSAGIALRDAAAELERQAARLRAKADLIDGAGAASGAKVLTKPKKVKKAKRSTAKKVKRATAKKRAPKGKAKARAAKVAKARKAMPAGSLAKLKGAAHANGAAHPAIQRR